MSHQTNTRVYLDNAATTALDPRVLEEMLPYFTTHFGNPSSIHADGSRVRSAIEKSRKKVAELLNTSPSEIFFTSGGTESDNTALRCATKSHQIQYIITSPLEHHAVLHTAEDLEKAGQVKLLYVAHDEKGNIDLADLARLLSKHPKALVSLMHANNEIGNILDWQIVGELCAQYGAVFHSDTVQTVGHYPIDLQEVDVHLIAGAAHKFYGPKGVGFMYIRQDAQICPYVTGGAQERNMRGGTENIYGIVGLAKALELCLAEREANYKHIFALKTYMIEKLCHVFKDAQFNGESQDPKKSSYKVLNVSLPKYELSDMLLFNLDIQGISASGGSACSSGSSLGSHVLRALQANPERTSIRFSFGKDNRKEDIDFTVAKLAEIYEIENASV
ncbi:MAG: cysteine desulfurase [Bernardetiaceae bacterium]|nr:cysteine desulfurase [Bernardetiaceae bacterium]